MTLSAQQCSPKRGDADRLSAAQYQSLLAELPDWSLNADGTAIQRSYRFRDYAEAMRFAARVAVMADAQDHHPDLWIRYGACTVSYNTHDVGGLSINDFICAAKADEYYTS